MWSTLASLILAASVTGAAPGGRDARIVGGGSGSSGIRAFDERSAGHIRTLSGG